MKLWKLEHPSPSYNECAGFVIAAPSEDAARGIAQANGGDETARRSMTKGMLRRGRRGAAFWTDPEKSRCTLLAAGSRVADASVVLRSYIGD